MSSRPSSPIFELDIYANDIHLQANLPDSAALYGLIGRIESLGLVLLDLHRSRILRPSTRVCIRARPTCRHRRRILGQRPQ